MTNSSSILLYMAIGTFDILTGMLNAALGLRTMAGFLFGIGSVLIAIAVVKIIRN